MITGAQVKAGRKLLGWSRDDLAGYSGLRPITIDVFERGMRPSDSPVMAIRSALDAAGVEFSEGDQVRMRSPK